MVKYRRLKVSGGIYFFTVNLRNRKEKYLTQYISLLTEAFRFVRKVFPFKTIAMVVLPNHMHVMWELPEGDDKYSVRWRKIKARFTRSLLKEGVMLNIDRRGEYYLWQRRFWEHVIRDEKDYDNHFNYIHYNPVKHGFVRKIKHWRYSTYHRYVRISGLPIKCSDPGDLFVGE